MHTRDMRSSVLPHMMRPLRQEKDNVPRVLSIACFSCASEAVGRTVRGGQWKTQPSHATRTS